MNSVIKLLIRTGIPLVSLFSVVGCELMEQQTGQVSYDVSGEIIGSHLSTSAGDISYSNMYCLIDKADSSFVWRMKYYTGATLMIMTCTGDWPPQIGVSYKLDADDYEILGLPYCYVASNENKPRYVASSGMVMFTHIKTENECLILSGTFEYDMYNVESGEERYIRDGVFVSIRTYRKEIDELFGLDGYNGETEDNMVTP